VLQQLQRIMVLKYVVPLIVEELMVIGIMVFVIVKHMCNELLDMGLMSFKKEDLRGTRGGQFLKKRVVNYLRH